MNLVYFTIGFQPGYVQLLEVCVASLRKKCDMTNIKLLLMCDINYLPHAQHIGFDYIIVTPDNHSPEQVSMRKVEIFGFDMIDNFKKVIYLDSDIVITGDLNTIFQEIVDDNLLYTFNESDDFNEHKLVYFGRQDYSDWQLDNFRRRDIKVFNCGQFGFMVSPQMKAHFANVLVLMRDTSRPSFYEQSFMNYYFNTRYLTDPIFNKYTALGTRGDMVHNKTIIVHFANATIPYTNKLKCMRALMT